MFATLFLFAMLPSATVQGSVRVEGSREPIAHATVQIPELGRGVLTDRNGYFVLTALPAGDWRVEAGAIGYRPHELVARVPARGSVRLDFELALQPVELSPLEVRRARGQRFSGEGFAPREVGPDALRIDAAVVSGMPALAEPDVLRAVQTLPAVQAASDFSSALYVRGGSPDQNLVLLDGAPVFNPYHLAGIFGAFDPDAVAAAEVIPGAFPARLGDRLASVVEVRTRDGGRDQVRGNGAIGLVSSRASLDGPLPGARGSYLVSVRRTYVDLFTEAAAALRLIPGAFPYAFADAHLKLTHDLGELGRLSSSLYLNDEGLRTPGQVELPGEGEFAWGSHVASLTYWQPLRPNLTAEFRGAFSGFRGQFDAWAERPQFDSLGMIVSRTLTHVVDTRTTMRNLFGAADLTWYHGAHRVRTGLQLDSYLFDYDVSQMGDLDFGVFVPEFQRTDRLSTVAAYLEDEWSVTGVLDLRAGLRVLHAGERGTAWMPRLGARFALSPTLYLSLGAGRYAQVLHSLRNEESLAASVMAYDLLAAVPREIGMTIAEDVAAGLQWSSGTTLLRVDTYARRIQGLPLPPVPEDPVRTPVLVHEDFRSGEGSARGVEVLALHRHGGVNLSLAYALSFAQRTIDGESFTPRFERRHTLDGLAAVPLGSRGQFGVRLAMATGQPYTPAVGVAEPYAYDPIRRTFWPDLRGAGRVLLLGEHNSERLPGYLRLDLGARRDFERRWFGRTVTLTPHLQVLNVLNSKNVLAAIPQVYGAHGPQIEYQPQLPIFPTFGVEWKF